MINEAPWFSALKFDPVTPIGWRHDAPDFERRPVYTFRDETRLRGREILRRAWNADRLPEGPTFFIDEDPPPSSELPDPD